MILAGDVGGTKTNLAIYSPEAGPRKPLAEATFPSARYPSLEAIVREFLARTNADAPSEWRAPSERVSESASQQVEVDRASFGVAGPVRAGRAAITNLPWVIEETRVQETLNLSAVRLLNDLEATAYAVPFLEPDDLHTLNEGEPAPGGAIAIVAPGTGLGEGYLTWDGSRYLAHPSEGGHSDFAPHAPFATELLRYLQDRFDHVSCERVCSGQGIPNIYAYLRDSGHADEPAWLAERLAAAGDPTPVIANTALDREKSCPLCVATLDAFVSILGAEAGNLAIKVLATGGVYLGGGIPPRILPALEKGQFMETFQRKGRLSDLMARMPVHVILNPKVALLGAACHGLDW